jgi:hypothetical protein
MLESCLWESNAFLTLTYDDGKVPSDGCVSKYDLQTFLKRLRYYYDDKIRYFGVGEYGGQTLRPHYHVIVFNMPACHNGITIRNKRGTPCCPVCSAIRDIWKRGHVLLGTVSMASANYVSGYVAKGWTNDTPVDGLEPEFTIKSLRPGIGHDFAYELASVLLQSNRQSVPYSVHHNGRYWPLGRYIRTKTAEFAGGLALDKAESNERVLTLSEDIYSDETIAPRLKAWALREALIAEQYPRSKAVERSYRRARERQTI